MKNLFIIRHGKSSWKDPKRLDSKRPLKKKGKKDATRVGKLLRKKKIYPDLFLSSPAKRATKTAERVAAPIKFPPHKLTISDVIYHGKVESLVKLLRSLDDKNNLVFLVGHNPELKDLVNYLTDEKIQSFPTSAAVYLEFDLKNWNEIKKGKARIVWMVTPKKNKTLS